MAVKSGVDRAYNYNLKYDTEVIKKQADARRERMVAKQTEAQEELSVLENKAKEVLGEAGVPTHTYIGYLNFCREVWKKKKRFSGETLRREAMVVENKWIARELKKTVLDALRLQVLTIPDPTP